MVCYHPMKAYPAKELNPETGKRPRTFSGTKSLIEGQLYTLPCGNCWGCRIDRAEGWAIRCTHHAQMAKSSGGSAFVTLTYSDEHLPFDNSLQLEVSQKFIRDLRYRVGRNMKLSYLGCGEYGEGKRRAHYHYLIFGYDFPDKVLWTQKRGHKLYTSALLEEVWPNGISRIGDVSYNSARYVASYVMKKKGGDQADAYYHRASPVTGEFHDVLPEFQVMSKRPGIGAGWFERYLRDVYPSDFVIVDGHPKKPPRYYDKLYAEASPEGFDHVLRQRKRRSLLAAEERTPERLAVRANVQYLNSLRYQRELDQ